MQELKNPAENLPETVDLEKNYDFFQKYTLQN